MRGPTYCENVLLYQLCKWIPMQSALSGPLLCEKTHSITVNVLVGCQHCLVRYCLERVFYYRANLVYGYHHYLVLHIEGH